MKGKKDKIALAATENAKVCTSVRVRYLIVARTRLGERLAGRGAGLGGAAFAGGTDVVGGVTTAFNRIRG